MPYLYSDADIAALMAVARELRSPLRAATYRRTHSGCRPRLDAPARR